MEKYFRSYDFKEKYIYYGQKDTNFVPVAHQRAFDYIDEANMGEKMKCINVETQNMAGGKLKGFRLERKGGVTAS